MGYYAHAVDLRVLQNVGIFDQLSDGQLFKNCCSTAYGEVTFKRWSCVVEGDEF
jgi:hypothetical protein